MNGPPPNGETCIVIFPEIRSGTQALRDAEARLEEGVGLAQAINLDVRSSEVIRVAKPRPSTLIGSGAAEKIGALVSTDTGSLGNIDVAVVDAQLTPVQQRNLERLWNLKVIDRTGLILEIFGDRARTREGRLQVELAALTYQRSRLVRSWTHLERQRGGAGFMGGPGETQIETDRRLIDQRITKLKRQLDDVKRTRDLHRAARNKVPYPIVALVGYTNAGKSTLFNLLTGASVEAKDQLFATLDPTMRGLPLPSGRQAILSDTVGFISDLPHELVNAFHATLEEVVQAMIVLHVRDASHPDTEAQKADVFRVLEDLGVHEDADTIIIEVLNKIDRLAADDREVLENRLERSNSPIVMISALSGEGGDRLLATIDTLLATGYEELDVDLDYGDGAGLGWLYEHGEVIERTDKEDRISLTVRLDAADADRFRRRHPT